MWASRPRIRKRKVPRAKMDSYSKRGLAGLMEFSMLPEAERNRITKEDERIRLQKMNMPEHTGFYDKRNRSALTELGIMPESDLHKRLYLNMPAHKLAKARARLKRTLRRAGVDQSDFLKSFPTKEVLFEASWEIENIFNVVGPERAHTVFNEGLRNIARTNFFRTRRHVELINRFIEENFSNRPGQVNILLKRLASIIRNWNSRMTTIMGYEKMSDILLVSNVAKPEKIIKLRPGSVELIMPKDQLKLLDLVDNLIAVGAVNNDTSLFELYVHVEADFLDRYSRAKQGEKKQMLDAFIEKLLPRSPG